MAKFEESQPHIYSPVAYRYLLAARCIDSDSPQILDVGGYQSRVVHLQSLFQSLEYSSVNVGPAWYKGENFDILYDGSTLPVEDQGYEYVIAVDTLEHIETKKRDIFISEMLRVARRRAILVFPFNNGGALFEQELIQLSSRWGIAKMPSLEEHIKYSIPTSGDVERWLRRYDLTCKFETDKSLYWHFQMAMLINQAALGSASEPVNRTLQSFMEEELASQKYNGDQEGAYRTVLIWDRN